jgi:hypothetical protein
VPLLLQLLVRDHPCKPALPTFTAAAHCCQAPACSVSTVSSVGLGRHRGCVGHDLTCPGLQVPAAMQHS